MAFKMKSGNTSSFKNMGSSPVKQIIPLHSTTTLEEKALQSKIAKEFKLPVSKKTKIAKVAKKQAFKEFDKWHATLKKTPSVYSDVPKKVSTTPQHHHKVTKGPEAMRPPKKAIVKSKMPKGFNITGSSKGDKFGKYQKVAKKGVKKGLGKIVKKSVGRLAGGPVTALAGMAYGAYKSGQKHSGGKAVKGQKSFMAESKKKTKSIYKKK